MAPVVILLGAILGAVVDLQAADAIGQTSIRRAYNPAKAPGPLRVSSANPRYFADDRGRIVYLTGSHTWSNFKEHSTVDPPAVFDYTEYLDFLEQYHHNFIRLWTFELFRASYKGKPRYTPLTPWPRTGPGLALDGKARFDLSRFDGNYFDRLRARAVAAGERGLYMSIMLFNGFGMQFSDPPWCWHGHPFNDRNNVNGIGRDVTTEKPYLIHTMSMPAVRAIQEAYVKKVIDTVNDLDNVLYEIANESGAYSTEWQYHFIRFIKSYEASKAKQHPVGMTFQYGTAHRGNDEALLQSLADWISPGPDDGYRDDPPPASGRKVIISDTDHLWGVGGDWTWVWKSFTRGLNPIYMDPYGDPDWPPADESARNAMDHTLMYAKKINLVRMKPHGELASSGYALANPGYEYLIYSPNGTHRLLRWLGWLDKSELSKSLHWLQDRLGLTNTITVDLTGFSAAFRIEWFNPRTGETHAGGVTTGGIKNAFSSPFLGDAVLYLTADRATTSQ